MNNPTLPYGIVHVRRNKWAFRFIKLLLFLVLLLLLPPFKKHSIWDQPILGLLFLVYVIMVFPWQETLKKQFYIYFGKMQKEDFIIIPIGRVVDKVPAPKLLPVWVPIFAKIGPTFLICIIPFFLAEMIGWTDFRYAAFFGLVMRLGDIASVFYYLPYWNNHMIEYYKIDSLLGIGVDYVDMYFFPSEQARSAIDYIEQSQNSGG